MNVDFDWARELTAVVNEVTQKEPTTISQVNSNVLPSPNQPGQFNLYTDHTFDQQHHGTRIAKSSVGEIHQSDLIGSGVGDLVRDTANQLFAKVSGTRIVRGKARRGLIFATVFVAYRMLGKTQNPNTLVRLFNISRKYALRG